VYRWAVGNQICARFLRQIVPYTIVKGEEIAIALELQASIDLWKFKLGNHSRFHPERDRVLADRERLCLKISELKHLTFPTA
jgi:hypothetical protein